MGMRVRPFLDPRAISEGLEGVLEALEDLDYMGRIKEVNEYLDKVRTIVKPGCSQDVLKTALSAMSSVTDILSVMTSQRPEVGLVFCGRQSPGGHNVVWGLHEALKIHNPKSVLLGFLGKYMINFYAPFPFVGLLSDAAQLAETFAEAKCSTKLKSQLISNVCTDALSAQKVQIFN
ncbi:hypothetical protein E3N88_18399 [Mikania micrantha]|uniref:Phosphofructokinase domain-containing protein n=1 Tax=Mikania micrantha TaxID=192012 RepID=A0A5N6NM43_9ASTR|nr:hypothetical protein E3N88_18399 [Mikania micrantha]